MLIATFGPSTGWAGKTIDYEGGVFTLEGHGQITASDVLAYDQRGDLEWAYDGLREWVASQSSSQTALPTSVESGSLMGAAVASGPAGAPPKKHRTGLIIAIVVAAVVVLILIIAAIGSIGSMDKAAGTAENTPAVAEPATPAPEPTSAAPTPEPAPTVAAAKATAYHGSGNRIVKIKKPSGDPAEAVIVAATHRGQSNFAVWTLDKQLQQGELLVNTIGNYRGTVPLDFEEGTETARIQVDADGAWTLKIKPMSSARSFSSDIKGKGDDVVLYDDGAKVATIKHRGSSNFTVWFYAQDGSDLLVNEIGNYQGESVLTGRAILAITADGPWSIVAK